MEIVGEYRIEASRETVWAGLNDPEILRQAIAGCEQIDKLSETEFTARVRAKIGPVSAKFQGKVTLSELDPPRSYRISGEGTSGAAGFARGGAWGGAWVRLEQRDGGTILSYKVEANVGGKLAQVGSRLIDGVARKMADDFFAKFAAVVAPGAAPPEVAPGAPPRPEAAPVPALPALPPLAWIAGLIVIVVILLAIFGLR